MKHQLTFMTIEALAFSLGRTAMLIKDGADIRIAALAQPVPYKGSWKMVRFNWDAEPERVATWSPSFQNH